MLQTILSVLQAPAHFLWSLVPWMFGLVVLPYLLRTRQSMIAKGRAIVWRIVSVIGRMAWMMCLWTGIPQWIDIKLTVWLQIHEPTNWSELAKKLKDGKTTAEEWVRRL